MILVRQLLAVIALGIGSLGLMGYVTGYDDLADWGCGTAIRPTGCMIVMAAGLMVTLMAHPISNHRSLREFMITSCGAFVGGVVAANFSWAVFVVGTNLTKIEIHNPSDLPSVGTNVAGLLLACAGWIRGVNGSPDRAIILSRFAGAIGGISLIGHALDWPLLYWSGITPWTTAISVPTGVALSLLGIGANGRETK